MRHVRASALSCLLASACASDPGEGTCTTDACGESSESSGATGSTGAGTTSTASTTGAVTSSDAASSGEASDGTGPTSGALGSTDAGTTSEESSVDASEAESSGGTSDDGSSSSRMTAKPIGTTDAVLGYWEYLPPGYGTGEAPPLLVFFHGASWTGDGSAASLDALLEVGPPNLIATDAWPNERPFVVLSPQWQASGCLDPAQADAFLQYAVATYDVDPQRIYLTAQSCGATGSWNYLAEHTDELVAAAVLISGDGRAAFEAAGCELGRVPLWGLHNELDAVDADGTIVPLEGLRACAPPPDVELTIFPGETEHDAWTKTYDLSAGLDIYGWMLERVHP